MTYIRTDVLVVGAGLGGIAAAIAVARAGRNVVLSEPTEWIGGQLTSQLVPLDEHRRIEKTGANASYRRLRQGVRQYYRDWYPLTEEARAFEALNPGAAWVSPISHEPRVGLAVLESMLAPFIASGLVTMLRRYEPVAAQTEGDRITAVQFQSLVGDPDIEVAAEYVLDATELGDLLPLADIEHVTGRESQAQTGEPSASAIADPLDMQSVTWCFAMDHLEGENHTIDKPRDYDKYRDLQSVGSRFPVLSFDGPEEGRRDRFDPNAGDDPFMIDVDHRRMGNNPDQWTYRRIIARDLFTPGAFKSDIVVANFNMNDYTLGPLFGVPDAAQHYEGARQLSLSLLYWLQTEAPRLDGGTGWPGLRLRADVAGTADGLAMAPYIRESRRIKALYTIVEQDVADDLRPDGRAVQYEDSVGVGHYYWLDMHATTGGRHEPAKHPAPFEIPLRSLVPERTRNLLAACKNIGTTHITNGCYRLHPVEWSIGEAAGALAAFCLDEGTEPHRVAESPDQVESFQRRLHSQGVQLRWPEYARTW